MSGNAVPSLVFGVPTYEEGGVAVWKKILTLANFLDALASLAFKLSLSNAYFFRFSKNTVIRVISIDAVNTVNTFNTINTVNTVDTFKSQYIQQSQCSQFRFTVNSINPLNSTIPMITTIPSC